MVVQAVAAVEVMDLQLLVEALQYQGKETAVVLDIMEVQIQQYLAAEAVAQVHLVAMLHQVMLAMVAQELHHILLGV